jgi:hypothetical protein
MPDLQALSHEPIAIGTGSSAHRDSFVKFLGGASFPPRSW